MATETVTLRMPETLANRYEQLGLETGCTKEFYIVKALSESIDCLERKYGIVQDVESHCVKKPGTAMSGVGEKP